MTPEQRAVKWFEKVPEADQLSFDERLAICKKTASTTSLVFGVLFLLEWILAYTLTDGSFAFIMSDILNSILLGTGRRVTTRGTAVVGLFVVAPFLIIPAVVTVFVRPIIFKKEIKKYLK